jgi:hypothetical protein
MLRLQHRSDILRSNTLNWLGGGNEEAAGQSTDVTAFRAAIDVMIGSTR